MRRKKKFSHKISNRYISSWYSTKWNTSFYYELAAVHSVQEIKPYYNKQRIWTTKKDRNYLLATTEPSYLPGIRIEYQCVTAAVDRLLQLTCVSHHDLLARLTTLRSKWFNLGRKILYRVVRIKVYDRIMQPNLPHKL